MNSPIVNATFRFVKWLYSEFLPIGYRDFQLDLAMELKNECVAFGLKKGLDDYDLEVLALAALLHNTGCIEGQYHNRDVSQTIARNFLSEKGFYDWQIEKVEASIEATAENCPAKDYRGKIIRKRKFTQANRMASDQLHFEEMGDVYP